MFFNESKFRKILREEAQRSLREQTGGYLSAGLAASPVPVFAPAAAAYRGYQNVQTRSAGLVLRYQDTAKPDPTGRLPALETDVRLVFYGGNAVSSFFNMTAGAGMFAKDLYFGDGGDFADMSEDSKEKIVKQTYDAIKSNSLTSDSFYQIVSQAFKLDPGTVGSYEPQKEASTTTEGTDTYFAMLSSIQNKFTSGAPAAVDPAAAAAAAAAGPAGPAKDWPSYVAATPAGGAEVQAAWIAYATATGVNAGFGTFARWYQANAKGFSPAQAAAKLALLSKGRGGAAPAAATASSNAEAPAVVTPADITNHPAEAAAVKAAETQMAAAEADANPLTKKQKIAAAKAARQAAKAALIAARQNLRAVKQENMFRSNSNRLNENDQFQLKNLKITWGK